MELSWLEIFRVMLRVFVFLSMGVIVLLLCSPKVYTKLNSLLTREFGYKKRLLPWIEKELSSVDEWFFKRRKTLSILCIIICVLVLFRI